MENNKFSNEINEKIATVFRLYAINPIKNDIDNSFDKFEKNLFSDDSPLAEISDNVNSVKRNSAGTNEKITALQDSVDLCEKAVLNSINVTAEQFSQTAQENQKNITSRIDSASTEVLERIKSENAFLKKIIYILTAVSGTSLACTVALLILNLLG